MAVSFPGSSSNQILVNSTGVPTSALYSVVCWMYFTSGTSNCAWSLDSATSGQYALCGTIFGTVMFDWSGSGGTNTIGAAASTGVWYRVGVVVNGTNATLYQGTATSALSTYTQSSNYTQPTGVLSWKIGGTTANSNNGNCRVAAFKTWDAVAFSAAEVDLETRCYLPVQIAGLSRWHPFVNAETTDYSGLGRTLTGGTGISTAAGPPIPWSRVTHGITIPWDPSTTVWYAVYDTTTGELLSTGTILPAGGLPAGQAYKEYITGQPDQSVYTWDTTARDFVLREGVTTIDRVADLVDEAGLSAVWADLTAPNSTTLQDRIGQLLGPYRYRLSSQDVDLT